MLRSTTDLINLRWRAAQSLLAICDGDRRRQRALRWAMRVEGAADQDILDELALLREQFAGRPRIFLVAEVNRLWLRLKGRSS
jgi:hypothetical protein